MLRSDEGRVRARAAVVGLCGFAVVVCAVLLTSGRGDLAGLDEAQGAAPEIQPTIADAFVSAHRPESNFGRAATLRVGGSSDARSYLRFGVPHTLRPGGFAARLHLFATSGSRAGVAVRLVSGQRWQEQTIAARSAPRPGPVVARRGRVRAGRWVSIDLTHVLEGRRTIDVALVRRGAHGGALRFVSREGEPARAPRLVIGEAPAAAPLVAAAGDIVCDPASPNRRNKVPGTCLDQATSDLIVSREPTAVLTLGDNQYEKGSLAAFRSAYDRTWGRVKAITRPSVGNHEYLTPAASGYFDYFNGPGRSNGRAGQRGQGYYSFDVGAWHLIALNSVCDEVGGCGPGSPQLQWLEADLAAHPAPCTLAYWHHPRFSSGEEHSSVRSDAFWRALYDAGADVVLNGHAHDYERFAPQTPDAEPDEARGLREFVVGTGGKNHYPFEEIEANSLVRDARTSGVLLLTLRADGYSWRFAPVPGGRLRDAGTGSCH